MPDALFRHPGRATRDLRLCAGAMLLAACLASPSQAGASPSPMPGAAVATAVAGAGPRAAPDGQAPVSATVASLGAPPTWDDAFAAFAAEDRA